MLGVLHAQVRDMAREFGVTTDAVLLAIGLLENDLSVICDPELASRVRDLHKQLPDPVQQEGLKLAATRFLESAALLGMDVRNPELQG